jgi:hypothetical protein
MESLERRGLLATLVSGGALSGPVPNETVDQAFQLGDLSTSLGVAVPGSIGSGPYGGADVDWYSFTLDRTMRVEAALAPGIQAGPFGGILSLYNDDPLDFQDPYNPDGYRLLEQAAGDGTGTGAGGAAAINRLLGPGTYELAVSGAGNADFHPLLAGSGYPGGTGSFVLQLSATDAGPGPSDGPAVLTTDPAAGAVLAASPFEVRLDLSAPLDPATLVPGQDVQLLYNPSAHFGDGNDQPVALSASNPVNFSSAAGELQITPEAPLAPGYYKVALEGNLDANPGQPVLAAPGGGLPLGSDAADPDGLDFSYVFQVNGIDGNTGPGAASDDTPATAHNLGDVTAAGLVQAAGAIGVDPYYNPASSDPSNNNPGDQVDLYHFQITGTGSYALLAQVFAGRINSPLDPGISLYRSIPGHGDGDGAPALQFVAGNNNTYDPIQTTNGQQVPLYSDSILSAGLTAGDYYLAVAGGSNTPSPFENLPPGTPGLFDPNVSHSGQLGWSTGPYVLNLLVTQPAAPPHVLTTSPAGGASLDQPPTSLTLQFDHTVDIAQLAFQTFQQTFQDTVSGVFVQAADGTKFFPRFQSYDPATNQATFLMLDRLPAGTYELHLSGAQGLTDFAGNPLVGNSPGGDYVATFTVLPGGPVPVPSGDPAAGYTIASQADAATLQDLGTLFPHELQAGVTLTRDAGQDPGQAPSDTSESYRFHVLQDETYTFNLSGTGLPDGVALSLTDQEGHSPSLVPLNNGQSLFGDLAPGTYTITVGDWSTGQSAEILYQLAITFTSANDNAPPLISGPTPALQLRLSSLPGPGAVDSSAPSDPVAPTPSAPASETGGLGAAGSSGTGALASTSGVVSPVSAPAAAAALADHATSSPSETAITPAGLLALSVAPVGSLSPNAPATALASAQVAFSLPSQPSTGPSLGSALIQLVTSIQVLGSDPTIDPDGPIVEMAALDAGNPAVVFDEALKRVAESVPVVPGSGTAVAALDPASDVPTPDLEGQGTAAPDSGPDQPPPTVARTARKQASEDAAEEVHEPIRLAGLAWGAAFACIASIPLILIKRACPARIDPGASLGRDRSPRGAGAPAGAGPFLAGQWRARSRRPHWIKRTPGRRAVSEKRRRNS